jgi:NAD(P)-dependent dehydrogenase (short-subunit alcohol dehydrogenase family)
MTDNDDRPWVLITGCSSGIGRALVPACRQAGWGVVATARSMAALDGLPPGPDLARLELDVTRPASLAAAAEACRGLRLTALVNNAGYGQMGPLEWLGSDELRAQFETNVVGLHAATRSFLPLIRARATPGEGRIVQVASVLGRVNVPMAGAYCASKHAVVALGEALRMELEPGIRVILVEPGAIRSEFRDTLVKALGTLPERIRGTRYEPVLARYLARHGSRQDHGLGADACARRIVAAMARRHPPRRVVIGADARLANAAKAVLPGGLWEWAVRRAFGL